MHDQTVDPPPDDDLREVQPLSANRGIVRAAVILSLGNVLSRVLGLARELVIATIFGPSGAVSAYRIATFVPMSIFQLIVGGEMVNSSLVPVFSDYTASDRPERRAELWDVVFSFLSVAIFFLVLFVLVVELFTPHIAALLGSGEFDAPGLEATTVRLMRIATPAVLFLSLASLISGVLYALKRFTLPAFTAAVLNGTIVIFALLGTDIIMLVLGLLVGAIMQVLIQLPGLRDARFDRVRANWRHPAIRRILILYAPIVVSLIVNQIAIAFSYRLATGVGDESIAYMGMATTLLQFPLGLVVTALSVATLPTLSQHAALRRWRSYKETLAGGLRLVLTLILPATVGLFALAVPIVRLLFERGAFLADDTAFTALVLRFYLFGLPFAAVDQMLIFASYARKDTWRPALVGVVSILVYSAVAVALLGPLGLLSLMVADAVKHAVHTVLMLWLLQRHVGGLRGYPVLPALFKALLASLVTGATAYGAAAWLLAVVPGGPFWARLLVVGAAGGVGLITYGGLAYLLDMREAKSLLTVWRRGRPAA